MTKTIAALVPMRHSSERVPGKNYRDFGGRPLYHHIVETLLACEKITDILIDTDSPLIMEDAAKNFPSVKLHERPEAIRGGDVPMNTILLHDTEQIEADWYLQTHSTNPLLKSETVTSAIETFLEKIPEYDSLFSVTPTRTRFWNADGGAVNHDPTELIRTQDLVPIYEENSNIYIFSRKTLKERGNRIGASPLMFEMDRLEAIDIDEEEDFLMAQLLYKLREKGQSKR